MNLNKTIQTQQDWADAGPILRARTAKGLTRVDLARLLGVSTTTLMFWESGFSLPRDPNMDKLCRVLGITRKSYTEWLDSKPTV